MATKQANCCVPAACAPSLERTRFFARQLVTPDDLTQDQVYFRDKARRHNRLLHGWGVVCGAEVKEAADENGNAMPWKLAIEAGYVLGPYGDEILIDRCIPLDVRTTGVDGSEMDCATAPADPWCSDVRIERAPDKPLYVAVRYSECSTRPVRAQAMGCGCEDTPCEYSRIRDGYVLAVLDALPSSHDPMPELDMMAILLGCTVNREKGRVVPRPCPPCPEAPWVVLADVKAGADGKLTIDNFTHRRFVMSFGALYTQCAFAKKTGNVDMFGSMKPADVQAMMSAFAAGGGAPAMPEEMQAALKRFHEHGEQPDE